MNKIKFYFFLANSLNIEKYLLYFSSGNAELNKQVDKDYVNASY